MSIIRKVLAKLIGFDKELSSLEKLILSAYRRELDEKSSSLWDEQIRTINRIQRLPGGVEVNFYRMHKGNPTFPPEIAFPNKEEEINFANVQIVLNETADTLLAKLWSINGYLFSIEYDGNAQYFDEALEMQSDLQVRVTCNVKSNLFCE